MKFKYTITSEIGKKRFDNEDAVGVFEIEDGLLSIVCDGLGGSNAGEVASRLAVQTVYDFFKNSTQPDFTERIKNSIRVANNKVLLKSSENSELSGMATTIEVLFIKGNSVFLGHVGDSRIYDYQEGRLRQITKDHSLVQKLLDDGYLTLQEAENHPNKNVITNALGDNKSLDIDTAKIELTTDKDIKYLLCTDGVTTVIKDLELQEIVGKNEIIDASEILSNLIEKRGAPDNYSFVIIELTN